MQPISIQIMVENRTLTAMPKAGAKSSLLSISSVAGLVDLTTRERHQGCASL